MDAKDAAAGRTGGAALARTEPDFHDEFAAFERNRIARRVSSAGEKVTHEIVGKTQPRVLMTVAQFLAVMRREIDDRNSPAGARHPRRFGQHSRRVLREMQHLVEQHRVEALRGERKCSEIALNELDLLGREMLQFGARDAQHVEALV